MAKEDIVIGIKAEVEGNMGKTLDNLNQKVKQVDKSVDHLSDTQKQSAKSAKDAGKSFASQAKEVATGIGIFKLADAALGMLKDALMSNAVVGETLKGFYEGFMIILGEVIGAVIKSITEGWDPLSRIFSNIFKIGKNLLNIVLTPFKPLFYEFVIAIKAFQLAWEMSPFGSGDTKTIEKLKKDIVEAKDELLNIPKSAVDSFKEIGDAASDIYDDSGKFSDIVVKNFKKINIEKALQQGKDLVALEKAAATSDEQTKRRLAELETEAEQKRQIRDDDTKSIEERIKANDELAGKLQEEKKIAKANAELQLQAAQARAAAQGTPENELKVEQAKTALKQVELDIEGKMSEQKQNKVNLGKEEVAMDQSRIDNLIELGVKEQQNTTARIKDEEKRLMQVKLDLEDEKLLTLKNLDDKIKATNENTQARVDAERAYLEKKIEFDNQLAATDDQINEVRKNKNKERLNVELQAFLNNENEKVSKMVQGSPARIEAERNILAQQLEFYKLHKSLYFKTDEEFAAKTAELNKQITESENAELAARRQNIISVTQEALTQLNSVITNVGQLNQAESDATLTRLKIENDAVLQAEAEKVNSYAVGTEQRKIAEKKFSEAKAGLDKKLEDQKKKLDKEAFERGKRMAIATTIINGAQAIISAFATPDPTLGIITALRVTAATIATGVQLAAIRNQTFDSSGSAPTMTSSEAPPAAGGPQPTTSAPSTMGIGNVNIMSRRQELQFQQVYVVESDIRNVMGRVETIENRSILGS